MTDADLAMEAGADTIAGRLSRVRGRIAAAAVAAGRDPRSVALVAVSKTHGIPAIREALAAGQRIFGENRVQEATAKFPLLKAEFPVPSP